jgi:hypothetical protein
MGDAGLGGGRQGGQDVHPTARDESDDLPGEGEGQIRRSGAVDGDVLDLL